MPSGTTRIRAAVFDAYGTIFDVHAAMQRHAARLGPDWQRISQAWRAKQLEASWILSAVGAYDGVTAFV